MIKNNTIVAALPMIFIIYLCYILGTVALASSVGLKITRIDMFYGPTIVEQSFGGTILSLHALPLGATVGIGSLNNENWNRYAGAGYRPLEDMSRGMMILLSLTGCISLAIFSVIALGVSSAANHILSGFRYVFIGALKPSSYAQELIGSFVDLVSNGSIRKAIGILAANILAYNLVPYLSSPTFQALNFAFYPEPSNAYSFPLLSLKSLLFLPFILVIGGWTIALMIWMIRGGLPKKNQVHE